MIYLVKKLWICKLFIERINFGELFDYSIIGVNSFCGNYKYSEGAKKKPI